MTTQSPHFTILSSVEFVHRLHFGNELLASIVPTWSFTFVHSVVDLLMWASVIATSIWLVRIAATGALKLINFSEKVLAICWRTAKRLLAKGLQRLLDRLNR